jgi:hypothetical protein
MGCSHSNINIWMCYLWRVTAIRSTFCLLVSFCHCRPGGPPSCRGRPFIPLGPDETHAQTTIYALSFVQMPIHLDGNWLMGELQIRLCLVRCVVVARYSLVYPSVILDLERPIWMLEPLWRARAPQFALHPNIHD